MMGVEESGILHNISDLNLYQPEAHITNRMEPILDKAMCVPEYLLSGLRSLTTSSFNHSSMFPIQFCLGLMNNRIDGTNSDL